MRTLSGKSPGASVATIGRSESRFFRSLRSACAMEGYCTFTTTSISRPLPSGSRIVARCTCPMLAAARGVSSKLR